MKSIIAGAALAAIIATPLAAQTSATTTEAPSTAIQAEPLVLNAGVPLTLAVAQEVNSSKAREGDYFRLTVLHDVKIGDTVVIPRGAPATAEVTWRTGKGAFGKSGKMEFALRTIDVQGTRIPITGEYRQEGEGNTIATGVGVLAVGVFAGFITGKRARLPMGRELMAQIAQPVPFTADGRVASSYDSAAAIAATEATTPLGMCRAQAKAQTSAKKKRKAEEKCFSERME